uniref:TROVE domain-containing protein n=1 Tax=Trichobilharzia regenti TaxID=157069 RepID=A0AA85KHJ6_TRIRE|nr:unnamed protein product [Trichobilharzia regenti]
MDYEYRHTKGSHLLSSPVYLKGECLVKNELLENTILQRNFITADTLPVLSTDNKLLSTLRFQTENHILTPCRKDTVNPTHDECSTKEPTDDYTTFKSQPVDWLQNAVVKISDVLPQNIFDCGCGETAEKQLVQDKFDLSINECKDTCRQPKIDLISCISSSIVDGIPSRERKKILGQLIQTCVSKDPEFILKAALYCRRELNIRTTTNLLIASACFHEKSQAFVSKYFSACISTPSDWLEVTEYYAVISGNSPLKGMPKVLRKNLTEKFSEFDQYQLAKHCRHKARANRSAKSKLQIKQPFGETMDTQVYTFIHRLTNSPPVYFTMKDIIRRLHISSPRFNVMCILGKKYPLDATDFIRMGLEGDWDESKAGKRMKLPVPLTWETELSVNGNNANSWTKLITSNKVPHMAMLRNLRNILKSGIPNSIHEIVLKRLTDARIIIDGKQFPFRYFTAFNTIHKLKTEFVLTRYLRAMQEKSNRRFRTVPRRLTKKYLWVEDYLRKVNLIRWTYDAKLLDRYQKALNTALELSIQHNLPPVCGSTLIICSTSKYTNRSAQKKSSRSKSYMPMMGFLLG